MMVELIGLGFDCLSYGTALGLLSNVALFMSSLDCCLQFCDIDENLISRIFYRFT